VLNALYITPLKFAITVFLWVFCTLSAQVHLSKAGWYNFRYNL